MVIKTNHLRRFSFVLLFCITSSASGAGLYIREFGHPGQGTAGTGAALAENASIAIQNPASLFELETDTEWLASAIILFSSVEFEPAAGTTIPGGDGGDAGGVLPGLSVFHTRKFSDKWGMTFALNSYAGSALEYDSDFVGRYQGFDVELLTVALSPSLVYKVNENLSASVGITMLYGQLDLKAAIPPLLGAATPDRDGLAKIDDGDDISAAITASLFWKVTNQFQLALTYLGENELEFDSDVSITLPGIGSGTTLGNIAADVEITFPQGLIFSTATDINDQLTMTTQVGWKEWSSLDEVPITTNVAGAAIPLDWDDVWSAGVGMRWKSQGPWTYYAGVSYASDPTNASDRVSILPVDEQWRLASGFTYERNNGNKIGGVITYIDLGDAPIDSTGAAGRYVGEYDTNYAVFLALNYNWK